MTVSAHPIGGVDVDSIAEGDRHLAVYLRDHLAGSEAGLALSRRAQHANEGTPLAAVLAAIEAEIVEERLSLRSMMERVGVAESRTKRLMGRAAALAARLKVNSRLGRYTELSRVVDIEALAAGVVTKRALWTSLRTVAATRSELDAPVLGQLIDQANAQYDRLMAEHDRAAAAAFAAST